MSDFQGRGYVLASSIRFLQETAGHEQAEEVLNGVSSELQEAVRNVHPANFYPIRLFAEFNRTLVAHLAGSDEDKAREVLINCGRHMGHEASNTFLKLLMRVITPEILVKKFPDLWGRDFTAGRVELKSTDKKLDFHMFDIEGYDHCGPMSAGWVGFNLEAMGKVLENTIIHDWSLDNPSQNGTWFEITWSN